MSATQPRAAARRTASKAKKAAANPTLELLERAGYVIRGVLYGMMGLLALGVAFGIGGQTTDQRGSLVVLVSNPAGQPILVVVAVGLAAYSLWGFVRAVFDPLHRGDDPTGIADRLGFAWSGFAYAGMVVFALQFLAGGGGAHGDSTQASARALLDWPGGQVVLGLIGAVAMAGGIGQFAEMVQARFRKDLKRDEMDQAEKRVADWLGRFGMFSRGVVFTLVGWFLVQAALYHDPARSHGFGGALAFLLAQPLGRVLTALVALGFVALGLHSLAAARWMRLLGSGR
jgi:hypothetical protein